MPRRKDRIPVVLDTNVLIAFHLSTNPQSANAKVYRLWRNKRKLQLVVSEETAEEYFAVLQRLGISEESFRRLRRRFDARPTITRVSLGSRPTSSRDPDDNLVLATAIAGKAKFLVTNDRDLLDLPPSEKKRFKFSIVTPAELLAELNEESDV